MNILNFLNGKKTYIIGGLIVAGALVILLTPLTLASSPDFVWLILNGLGLAAVRDGINSASENDNKGWKTYLASAGILVLGLLKMFGIDFPVEILAALEGLGIVGIRQAISKIE
jgi:hypothetical protein